MMKLPSGLVTLLAISAVGGFSLSAQPTPASPPAAADGLGPIIQFNTETYEFGKALAGDDVHYTYIITNSGDQTLEITSVHPGCSCTVVGGSWTPKVEAHKTGIIPVSVHTSGRGEIDKIITVTSNDKARPTVMLHVRGTVWVPIEVSPSSLAYFTVKPDGVANAPQTLMIFNRTEEPLVLSAPEVNSPLFSAELITNRPGEEFQLKISYVSPKGASPPRLASSPMADIKLKTSVSNMPELAVRAIAKLLPEIEYMPPQINVASGPLPRGATNYITLINNTAVPLKVLDASVNIPGVYVDIGVLAANTNYTVAVGFPKGFDFSPQQKMAVTIRTDNPHFPTIEVPVLPVLPVQTEPRRTLIPAPAPIPAPSASVSAPAPIPAPAAVSTTRLP